MDNAHTEKVSLYLGAGKDHKDGFINVDIVDFPGIDLVADVTKGLPFSDSSVDHVCTRDMMEHLPQESKVPVINEIWRVLKDGGTMEHYIPNAGSRNDFGSPSHLSHWNLQQFEHFDLDSYRYPLDHDYEGFIGGFRKVLAEEVNWRDEYGVQIPQSIHVIYRAVKEDA